MTIASQVDSMHFIVTADSVLYVFCSHNDGPHSLFFENMLCVVDTMQFYLSVVLFEGWTCHGLSRCQ